MADYKNENILTSLRSLIWGAFVGVLSFQLLAPTVWNYLDEALGLRPIVSYWAFTLIYFLVLPGVVLGWLLANRTLIGIYLPDYMGTLTKQSKVFLYGLIILVIGQLAITAFSFRYHWSPYTFYFVFWIYFFCCGFLLFACYRFCKQHVRTALKTPKGKVELESWNEIRRKGIKAFHRLYFPTIIVFGVLFAVAFLFLKNYFHHKEIAKQLPVRSSFEAGKNGFALQNANDMIQSHINRLNDLLVNFSEVRQRDSLAFIVTLPDNVLSSVGNQSDGIPDTPNKLPHPSIFKFGEIVLNLIDKVNL